MVNGQSEHRTEKDGTGEGAYPPEVAEFVERFAAELTGAGMQRMASRVFACLLAEESGALGSAELSERLRISPAAVSGAVRYLSQVHLVTREREPGSRRERYRVHANTWYEAIADRDALLGRWATTFEQGIEAVGPDSQAGRRLAETAEFFAFMREELSRMVERWYAHRGVPRTAGHGDREGSATSS
ncbi:GbsR/MarR family transcriptional regulator [Streptomyces taklimakanensis]|uniref:GbsR/MarR family transcriptional regulator n=1 Tax=Streptomyces taklimakanensis TaxID=2569853 RepID=UPI003B75CD42